MRRKPKKKKNAKNGKRIAPRDIIKTDPQRKVLVRDAHIDEISRWTCPKASRSKSNRSFSRITYVLLG